MKEICSSSSFTTAYVRPSALYSHCSPHLINVVIYKRIYVDSITPTLVNNIITRTLQSCDTC